MIGCLNRIFDISLGSTSYFLWNNANLDELELFTTEADFENRIISYHQKLISLWINPMTAGKIKTVLSELSRNTFEHNFGKRWTTWPLMVNMIHHQVSQKKLLFSLFDIGVWCSGTLWYKFPWLTEYEYICKAMTEWVTCREDDSNGWLWLPYLKKVVFREDKNYPDPEIIFRSNATTIEFDAEENILLKDEVKQAIISWVHVYFVISY
jgi:anti-sigma regulatory factor (Ser/Thr protein kinase)